MTGFGCALCLSTRIQEGPRADGLSIVRVSARSALVCIFCDAADRDISASRAAVDFTFNNTRDPQLPRYRRPFIIAITVQSINQGATNALQLFNRSRSEAQASRIQYCNQLWLQPPSNTSRSHSRLPSPSSAVHISLPAPGSGHC